MPRIASMTMTSALPGGIVDQDLENHGSSRWSNITCNYFKRKPGLRWMRRRYIMADFHSVSKEEERLLCTSLKIECKETNKHKDNQVVVGAVDLL